MSALPNWKLCAHEGWGRTSCAHALTARPDRLSQLAASWGDNSHAPILPVGLGRSYGDQCVPDDSAHTHALRTTELDRLFGFDPQSGVLVAEGGISLGEIARLFLPQGWFLPVVPGTGFVTLGGAIANDVHGKNHVASGSFGQHIVWLDLLLPDGQTLRCSREQQADIFFATIGGMGLTGLIVRAALQLKAVAGHAMAVTRQRVEDIDALFAAFADSGHGESYKVAWIDALAGGDHLGRGIFERADFIDHPLSHKSTQTGGPSLPFDFPSFALNPLSIGLFNSLRYHLKASATPKRHIQSPASFLTPLDNIKQWNRMYGKRGFHQFQAVIPQAMAPHGIRALLLAISNSKCASFLAVIKQLGAEGEGLLSFPMPGMTLALDFPNTTATQKLLPHLIGLTREFGGRVYLGKDSALTSADFSAMYPRLPHFMQLRSQLDPQGRLRSRMALRLGLLQEGAAYGL